ILMFQTLQDQFWRALLKHDTKSQVICGRPSTSRAIDHPVAFPPVAKPATQRRMEGFSFPLVFGAGVLSFLSPCVLPLVPPYLTYMSGASFDQLRDDGASAGVIWRRSVFTSLFFIAGFSIVFILFGATATALGQTFRQLLPIMMPLAGIVIIA